ncbi:hypothetical protein PR202_gb29549 [Eleusine coracana subsp. coracana]|uniref:Retrotransposon gag domain-containing protein n=1 Tax=Eleusine coracana subsp. coracana TaxID=191504 RepID=A0AAV5FXH7_ELECO|nr:hypothetical protein PR202_gb29549 [Eleusine coracana subsp. coracana]
MVHTLNQEDPESSQQGANAEPLLAEVLAAALNQQQNDSELLCRLVDITTHLDGQGGNRHNNNQPRQSTYSDFLGTHPPTFERAREPLDADHWLRQTETKFGLLECTEHQKVLFAAQQLQGSASTWWANCVASLPAGCRVEWNDFKTAFHAHFIPAGLMQRKFQEFMDLKHGGRNVLQYSEAFNHLAQYATEYVNTEEKKRYAFLHGMNATLKERLTWQITGTYNDLVNAAIVQEGAMHQVKEEDRKRKAPASATAAPQAKHRLIYTSPHRTAFSGIIAATQGNQNAHAPQPADGGSNYPCYNCGRTSHFAKNFTAPMRNNNNQRLNQSRNVNAPSRGAQVNNTNAEDIP